MLKKDTQIVETVSGTWLRFPSSFKKAHCLVELPNQLSLNINMKSGEVHVYKKDANQVYQPFGEMHLSAINQQLHCAILPHPFGEMEAERVMAQSDAS